MCHCYNVEFVSVLLLQLKVYLTVSTIVGRSDGSHRDETDGGSAERRDRSEAVREAPSKAGYERRRSLSPRKFFCPHGHEV